MEWQDSKYLTGDFTVKTLKFNGGEVGVRVMGKSGHNSPIKTLTCYLTSSDAIMEMIQAVDSIKRRWVVNNYTYKLHLLIPYFPYARQDRVCNSGESLSVKAFADLVNSLEAESVTIFDPHSDVTPALINNVHVYEQHEMLSGLTGKFSDFTVIAPDAGAAKKAYKLAQKWDRPLVFASKNRSVLTGDILSTTIMGDVEGQNCLIVDDICDGGATFTSLAEVLLARGAAEVQLFVTHGIFSQGFAPFKGKIKKIWWTNSRGQDITLNPFTVHSYEEEAQSNS